MTKRPILKLPDPSLGSPPSLVPAACLVERIDLEQAEALLLSSRKGSMEWTLASPPRTHLTAPWAEVKARMQSADELWTYETFAECERKSRRDRGIALVRRRRAIARIGTHTLYRWWSVRDE